MSQKTLQEQIAYYQARANEYDEWFYRQGRYDRGTQFNQLWFDEVAVVKNSLKALPQVGTILELACGTGIWTQELIELGEQITAIDASQEMLKINRAKVNSFKVTYQQLDLFSWQPSQQYDLVFFAFWLSHVPPDRLDEFFRKVYRSVRSHGQVFLIDSRFSETSSAKNHFFRDEKVIYQKRKLNDGRKFQIIKIYYQPEELIEKLERVGFKVEILITDNYFISAKGIKL
jgi:demethylmenaquinone methyltransferase/2-methoxy-6-polyprenyl-1,4-benzoquinol methylase